MIDEMTKASLHVSTDGDAGPYLMVPVTQLDAVLAAARPPQGSLLG